MKPKFYSLAIVLVFGLLALINAASSFPTLPLQEVSPTPTVGATVVESQAGSTNGIAFLGILIFAVIVFAIALHFRDLRLTERGKSSQGDF